MRLVFVFAALATCLPAQKLPFTVDAMMKLARISEPQISPDGNSVAFTVETVDVEKNAKPKHIYVVPVAGGTALKVTNEGASNQRPRWMPDSKTIAFISDRGGSPQIWTMSADGSNPKQITNEKGGAGGAAVSADGKWFVFTSDIEWEPGKPAPIGSARVYTSLLYRHWKTWQGKTRQHLLVVSSAGGPSRDLTPGAFDVPPFSLGGPDDYAISPDSSEVVYAANTDSNLAISTNTDLFSIPIQGGELKRLTNNPGADQSPAYSPDGKWIAYRSQQRAGYESDRWRLAVIDRSNGVSRVLNESQDRPVESIAWAPNSSAIFYTVEDRGRASVQMIPAGGGGGRAVITGPSHIDDVQFTPDGKTMIYSEQSGSKPVEIYRAASGGGAAVALTKLNDSLLVQYELTSIEEFWVENPEDKTKIHSFLVKPAGFQTGKKYPVLFLIHGGPQGAWGESWTYRWNAQVFAGAGFAVIMPNPRGSIGYGQKFTDEINQDWGGRAYEDIMSVVDHVTAQPYADARRMAAAGASYGGYMVNWMLGHTTRFKALVSHAGAFDLASANLETEELWFPIWEFKGLPWENPELYAKMSPSSFVKNFQTPALVSHGELDYRVPYGQALQLFTALQMRKVPSKLVVFPDEGHWVLKPQNSLFWYRTVLDWIGEWTKKAEKSGG